MQYLSAIPSPPLQFLVKQYWGMENCFSAGKAHVERIIPTGLPVLYFYLNHRPLILQSKKRLTSTAYLCGQYNRFYDLQVAGHLHLFAVVFQPYAMPLFFNLPAFDFFNHQIPLKEALPEIGAELSNKIEEASTFHQRVFVLECFFLRQLKKYSSFDYLPRLQDSLNQLNREAVSTSQLAENACLSRKQYERVFQKFIGLPPRQFIKVLRLQKALWHKKMAPCENLSSIAVSSGYFDQSHMVREFKSLTGMTPKHYFSNCEPHADYFMN